MINVIIIYEPANPPILWNEIAKFERILRSPEGRQWCELHRYVKEVLFNVLQDIQTMIAYFVNEARKPVYKNLVSSWTPMTTAIFDDASKQAHEIRRACQSIIMSMSAGIYKESTLLLKVLTLNQKRRKRASPDSSQSSQSSNRQRTTTNATGATTATTPAGSTPATPGAQPLPGKKVFHHTGNPQPARLPNPGAIFPHATRPNSFTILCCRSAFHGRTCPLPNCSYHHFPN